MELFYKLKQLVKNFYNNLTGQSTKYIVVHDGLYMVGDDNELKQRNNEKLIVLDKSFDMDANQTLYLVRTQNNTVHICEVEYLRDTTPYNIKVSLRYYKYLKDQKAD